MPGNDKQTQQKRLTGNRKQDLTPLTFTGVDEREAETMPDEDLLAEDHPITSETPRNNTSAIRFNNPTGPRRRDSSTSSQPAQQSTIPVPTRRTAQSPTPNSTQARPIRNTSIQSSWNPTASKPLAPTKQQRNMHWLLYVGVGMIAALALWVVASSALAWGVAKYNDITYGYPRTFQTDAVVGHGGDSRAQPSHFIAVNLHGQVIVVELMAGNPAKSINYTGPNLFEQGGDLIPVSLQFRDVTDDGKPDMIIDIQGKYFVFVNDGTKFRPSNSSDKIHL